MSGKGWSAVIIAVPLECEPPKVCYMEDGVLDKKRLIDELNEGIYNPRQSYIYNFSGIPDNADFIGTCVMVEQCCVYYSFRHDAFPYRNVYDGVPVIGWSRKIEQQEEGKEDESSSIGTESIDSTG